ncbi:uncharacterized protein LOC106012208 [Aplysia californica]|uniref:Uncharacterized protein LOC106012208 n=1 Tax=Aplysia californica TaxID=6500 RepID=A0ABM1A345_APLCA|nr:uncharacterized protein LOC106012208 [Aplysia californica]
MHRATDDVPTIARLSGTRQCCVLYVIFTMAAVCVVVASTDVTTNPQNGGATGNAFVYDDYRSNSTLQLDIVFICDGTAREYCSADVMMSEINKHFPPPDDLFFSDEDSSFNISDCDVNPQSKCHNFFSNTKNTTSPPNGVRYSLVNNSIVATKLLESDSSSSFFLKLNVTFHVLTGDYPDLLVEINTLAVTASADVIIAVGGAVTLQSSAFVGDALDIPTIGYITNFKDGIKNIYGRTFTSLNPSPEAQGTALAQVIGSFNMKQTTVMVEDTRLADGFLSGVRKVVGDRNQDVFRILPLQRDIR